MEEEGAIGTSRNAVRKCISRRQARRSAFVERPQYWSLQPKAELESEEDPGSDDVTPAGTVTSFRSEKRCQTQSPKFM